MTKTMWASALLTGLAALALTGCQSRPGGRISTSMKAANSQLRSQIAIDPQPLVGAFYRQVGRCTYSQARGLAGGTPVLSSFSLTVRPVRDRLLITLVDGKSSSTALISADGTLHDFNLVDDAGRRWTTETYASQVRGLANDQPGVVINQFTAIFPRYIMSPWSVGSVVADIRDQNGILWAEYIYRGRAQLKGRPAAVLDMVTTASKNSQRVLAGFLVVDAETLVPLLYVFQTQNEIKLERSSCP